MIEHSNSPLNLNVRGSPYSVETLTSTALQLQPVSDRLIAAAWAAVNATRLM